jgi:hypothetical protein
MNELIAELTLLSAGVARRSQGHAETGGAAAGARVRALLYRAVREPFLHFVILGAGLFFLNHHLEERARFTHIAITKDQARGIADNYRLQYGAYPDAGQLESLVEAFTREEVFYHEALKLGLDKDDEIVRRRLVQKYQFLQQDLTIGREPTDSELRAWFTAHPDPYRIPARLSFSHVYFSADQRGEAGAQQAARQLAAQLSAAGVQRAADAGDRFPGPQDFSALTEDETAKVFGKDGLSTALFGLAPGHWSEPLRSGFGWHVVYVNAREPGRAATFDEVRDNVRRDYLEAARAARNAEVYAKLRKGFEIVRE